MQDLHSQTLLSSLLQEMIMANASQVIDIRPDECYVETFHGYLF